MTKPAAILICPQVALNNLPEQERAIVRRFLFDNIRGLDEQHDKRWRRFWGRIWNSDAGEVTHLEVVVDRSGPFHRRHMSMEQALFDRQDQFRKLKDMRWWLKSGAGFGEFKLLKNDGMKFIPYSTSYETCSDDEMKELHQDMLDFLRTPFAQRRLWPRLSADKREEMLESILDPAEREH
ncbi:MAG: hypothetical protein WAW73_20315 [Rhodoferax sp.]